MPFRAVACEKKLQDVGVESKVAQAHAEAMEKFVVGEVVPKEHLDTKLAELDTKLADLETRDDSLDRFSWATFQRTGLRALPDGPNERDEDRHHDADGGRTDSANARGALAVVPFQAMNGFDRRSAPNVLVGPWPQMNATSSPSGSSLVLIAPISASWSP
jgi:hypothetical protein